MKREFTPENITELGQDEVFVFGSNLAGKHAGGAARIAREKFGAVIGQGVGLQGRSYAIPTMQGGIETIKPYVDEFIELASLYYNKKFYVTRIGCGIAGFRDEEIAPLFEKAMDCFNIILPRSFVEAIGKRRREKAEKVLTPWPVANYTVYNLLVDLILALEGDVNERTDNLRNSIFSALRFYTLDLPDKELADYLEKHRTDIIKGTDKKQIIGAISEMLGLYNLNLVQQCMCRIFAAKAYNLAYILFRSYKFNPNSSAGDDIFHKFDYTFFCILTGRWNCGDNSYMYGDWRDCVNFFCRELKEHENEITTDGKFVREKFLNFVSRPYIWEYCRQHDGHSMEQSIKLQLGR